MSPNPVISPLRAGTWKSPAAVCFTVLTLVFLCGAVVGALAMNLGVHKPLHKKAFYTEAGKTGYVEKVRKELDLSAAQTVQLESILDDFSKYYVTVVADGKFRIMQILNDNQKHKFEKMLQESSR